MYSVTMQSTLLKSASSKFELKNSGRFFNLVLLRVNKSKIRVWVIAPWQERKAPVVKQGIAGPKLDLLILFILFILLA